MASRGATAAHKLHAVTLIRSGIGRPWWEKRTLRALKLERLNQTVVHKNIPSVNGQLKLVKTLVQVRPVVVNEDHLEAALKKFEGISTEEVEISANLRCAQFLDSAGKFDIHEFLKFHSSELINLEKKSKETLILEATAKKRKVGKSKKC